MKLRKALDKAQREREEGKQVMPERVPTFNMETVSGGKGWIPPDYTESRTVALDNDKVAENRCVCIFPDAPEIDYYKVLRTQIRQRSKGNGLNTIMITSVHPGEGKTITSINLAMTFAREFNQTVLLVDSDLKRQDVCRYLDISSETGLINYLEGDMSLNDLIIWPGVEKLTLISGGKGVHNSSELLGSPKMAALVSEMKHRYNDRYIIFDVPPILGGADALAFTQMVDSVVMVVEAGKTSLNDVKKAVELIPEDKFLGFVLNRQKLPASKGYAA